MTPMKSNKMERREKPESELNEYADVKNILIDGGVNIQDADEIIRQCHEKFHREIKPKILEEAVQKALEDLCKIPGVKVGDKIDAVIEKTVFEVEKSFVGDPEKEEKTIYRGPGGIELKENSNN